MDQQSFHSVHPKYTESLNANAAPEHFLEGPEAATTLNFIIESSCYFLLLGDTNHSMD